MERFDIFENISNYRKENSKAIRNISLAIDISNDKKIVRKYFWKRVEIPMVANISLQTHFKSSKQTRIHPE